MNASEGGEPGPAPGSGSASGSGPGPADVVGVVGAGTMGAGIAQVFAAAGHPVVVVDVAREALARAAAAVGKSLARFVKKGAVSEVEAAAARERIAYRTEIDALAPAGLVVEAIVEDEAGKRALFARLDATCAAGTVLASNTSSISITRLAAATRRAPRVVGMHFMNPVPVMTLVEVIRGEDTADATVAALREACARLGKTAVEVQDYPGFVSNRVLMPMLNEAFFCVFEGVARPDAVDQVMRLGMSHPLGPLALADLIGLDVCLSILEVLGRDLGDPKYRPCPLLKRMVAAGHLGKKTGRGFYRYGPEGERVE